MQAHHIFPDALKNLFERKFGLNVNNPLYGAWAKSPGHQGWSLRYENLWRNWLKAEHTVEEAFDYARRIAPGFGFKVPW